MSRTREQPNSSSPREQTYSQLRVTKKHELEMASRWAHLASNQETDILLGFCDLFRTCDYELILEEFM
jgi:hypothetical protein